MPVPVPGRACGSERVVICHLRFATVGMRIGLGGKSHTITRVREGVMLVLVLVLGKGRRGQGGVVRASGRCLGRGPGLE